LARGEKNKDAKFPYAILNLYSKKDRVDFLPGNFLKYEYILGTKILQFFNNEILVFDSKKN
jgi:hypothetical protein